MQKKDVEMEYRIHEKCGNNTGSYAGKSITYLGGEQYERVQKAYGFFVALVEKSSSGGYHDPDPCTDSRKRVFT